jgi:eukaryotic-like serine/threonine-protein kinase
MDRQWIIVGIVLLLLPSAFMIPKVIGTTESNDDWPMYHHDRAYTGATNSSAPKSMPNVIWSVQSEISMAPFSPVIANGIVYVATSNLYAYNASTGEALWSIDNGGESSPIIANGMVFTGAYNGSSYNASTGAVIWRCGNVSSSSSTIAFNGGYIFTKNENGYIQALNATTGKIVWTKTGVYRLYAATSDGYIYCYLSGKLSALDAYDGTLVWQTKVSSRELYSCFAISLGHIYVGCDDCNLYCLDASTGEKIWNYTMNGWVRSCPSLADDYVYVQSGVEEVYALNASTGEKLWNFNTGNSFLNHVDSSPVVADGVVYISGANGYLYALDAYRGVELWSYNEVHYEGYVKETGYSLSAPAIAEGKIYVGSMHHLVLVLGPSQDFFVILTVILAVTISLCIWVFWRQHKNHKASQVYSAAASNSSG